MALPKPVLLPAPKATARPALLGGGGKRLPRPVLLAGGAGGPAPSAPSKPHGAGGFGGLLGQAQDIIGGIPRGIVGLGSSLVSEEVANPIRALASGKFGVENVPVANLGYGLGRGFLNAVAEGEGQKPPEDVSQTPLSSGFGASFGRTLEDVVHPTRLTRAFQQGTFLSKAIEDAANAGLVGGVVAKGIDAASGGVVGRAAEERAAAEALSGKAIPAVQGEIDKLTQAASTDAQTLERARAAVAENPTPQSAATFAKIKDTIDARGRELSDQLTQHQANLRQFQADAARHAETADQLVAQAGPYLRAYRVARSIQTMGSKSSFAPAAPYELAGKALGAAANKLIGSSPVLREAMGKLADITSHISERARQGHETRQIITNALLEHEPQLGAEVGAAEGLARELRDHQELFPVVLGEVAGVGPVLSAQYERLRALDPATADQAVAQLAKAPDVAWDAQSIQTMLDHEAGRLDPATSQLIQQAKDYYELELGRLLDAQHATGYGARTVPTELGAEMRQYDIAGTTPNPVATGKLEQTQAQRREALLADLADRGDQLSKAARKLTLPPGTKLTPENAQQVLSNAGVQIPRGALGKVEAAARAQGAVGVAKRAALRLRVLRDQIPAQVSDEAVQRVGAAFDRAFKARDAVDAQLSLRAEPGVATEAADKVLAARAGAMRAEVRRLADEAHAAYVDALPMTDLPFIPADLSDYHAAMLDQLGVRGDRGIEAAAQSLMDRNRRLAPAEAWQRAYTTLYNKLPRWVQDGLRKLTPDEVQALYERSRNGTLVDAVGGLDTLAGEFDQAHHYATEPEAITAMLDTYARKVILAGARSRRFLSEGDLGRLAGALPGVEGHALLSDPVMREVLGAPNAARAAEALRAQQAQLAAPPIPHVPTLEADLANEPFPYDQRVAEDAIAHSLDGPEGPRTQEFFDRWQAAGSPDLTRVIADVQEGNPPPWLSMTREEIANSALEAPRGTILEQPAAPATGVPPEAARSVAQVAATEGGQAVRGRLGGEAARLESEATRRSAVAERLPAAESQLQGEAAARFGKVFTKQGRFEERYAVALRKFGAVARRVEKLPEREAAQYARVADDFANAPARYRPAIIMARQMQNAVNGLAAEAEKLDPAMAEEIARTGLDALTTLRQITLPGHVSGPGGELTALPPAAEPRFVPTTGVPGPVEGSKVSRPKGIRTRVPVESHLKKTARVPQNLEELRGYILRRERAHLVNETLRTAEARLGVRAGQAIPELIDQLGTEADPIASGNAILAAMKERGYVAWDPTSMFSEITDARRAPVGPETTFLPQSVFHQLDQQFRPGGRFDAVMRKYYDRPIALWRTLTLSLRPAWLLQHTLGHALLASGAGGLGPRELVQSMGDAAALIKRERLAAAVQHPEGVVRTGPFAGARAARAVERAPGRLAQVEQRVGRIPEERQALLTEGRPQAPVVQRGAGAALNLPGEVAGRNPVSSFARASANIAGFADDTGRLAIYLSKGARMTDRELADFVAQNPVLAGLHNATELRQQAAVRLSLRAAGWFTKMNALERQYVRRIFPFYGWLRHVTQLAYRLPIYSPARVLWTLHLADLYGQPTEFDIVRGAIPLGGNRFLQLPNVNPYGDLARFDPGNLGFNLSPAIRLGVAGATGVDITHDQQFLRPPGEGNLDQYGRPGITPLLAPSQLGRFAYLAASQFPQFGVLRGAVDTARYGQPLLRYPLGEPYASATGPITAGTGRLGPAAGYLGVPYVRTFNEAAAKQTKARRVATAAAARRSYLANLAK